MSVAAASGEAFGTGAFAPFDVGTVQKELQRIRKELAAPPASVTRACMMNVVAVCEGDDLVARAEAEIAALAGRFPCRFFLIAIDRKAPAALEASVGVRCQPLPSGDRLVTCEQLVIRARGASAEVAASTVPPLLVAELPVVVWWPGDPAMAAPGARAFLDFADSAMFDSARSADPDALVRRLAGFLDDPSVDAGPLDLAWARIRPWREIVADFFDFPDFTSHATQVRRISVGYARGGKEPAIEAWLLAGWAASRLPSDAVESVTVTPMAAERPGSVQSVVLEADRGDPPAVFRAERLAGTDVVRAEVDTPITCAIPRRIVSTVPDELVCLHAGLESPGRDLLFEEALLAASSWMRR